MRKLLSTLAHLLFSHINISLFLGKSFSDPCNSPDHRFDIDRLHERAPRVPMYVRTHACTRLTDICIQTNVRYTIRARAPRVYIYTHVEIPNGRQKDQMCVGTSGRGSRRKGEEGKRRKEGGQTTETEKHTSQVQRAERSDWDPLECNELFFFLFSFPP